jgi:hypothetical protein
MKIEQHDFSLSQRYFIKHLEDVIEKPPNKHDKKLRKLEPLIDDSRARPGREHVEQKNHKK